MAAYCNPNWVKGVSGNPGGRKKPAYDIIAMCKANAPDIIQRLINMALGRLPDVDYNTQVKAAESIINRAYGKPSQAIDMTTNGQSLQNVFVLPKESFEEPSMDDWVNTHKPKSNSELN